MSQPLDLSDMAEGQRANVQHLPTVLQIAGMLLLAAVAGFLFPPAGFVVLAVELLVVGHLMEEEPEDARKPPTT